jgi:hypothetical protein
MLDSNYKMISGFYGYNTPCTIFIDTADGWYCVEGSTNVNQAEDLNLLINGVNVEGLNDVDTFTINEVDDLGGFEGLIDRYVLGIE